MNQATIQIEEVNQVFALNPKTFSTGSKGFHGFGKMKLPNGKRYQVNIMAVEIGSKPKTK